VIDVHDLRVVFGRTVALDGIDLKVPAGVHGLFGPNGSGKSTLLRAVAGLTRPARGAVSWRGRAVRAADEDFRGRVGYAGHEAGLYARLTVGENLALFARLHGRDAERVHDVASLLDVEGLLERPVRDLSAGLKRRAAVARALVHEPDLLLLDEPFANLDDDAAELVSAAVRAWRGPDRCALIATHGAKRLKSWVDGAIVLRRGRVATSGAYGPDHRYVSEARG
jgi:heme ABC exporter ATP-binding subunit CcmA